MFERPGASREKSESQEAFDKPLQVPVVPVHLLHASVVKGSEGAQTDPKTGNIVVCANNINDEGSVKAGTIVIEDVVHELVHSLDRCLKKDCFSNCKCRACSEIKAYDQSGQCAKGGSLRAGFKTYRACIKHYAWESTKVDKNCTIDDVTSQLSTCIGLPLT